MLRGPDDKKMGCKGTIELLVQIGNAEHPCTFYVLATGQNVLLSLPDIRKFGLIIDTQRHLCHIRDPVDICSNVMVQHIEENSNLYHLCTVRQSYTIDCLNKLSINVQFVEKHIENKYLYKTVVIYDCTCAIKSKILCNTCTEAVPYKTIIWPKKIRFEYNPIIRQNLKPQKDFFQLYICQEITKGVNHITAESSGRKISQQEVLIFE